MCIQLSVCFCICTFTVTFRPTFELKSWPNPLFSVKNNREFVIEQVLVITSLFQWENRRFNQRTTVNSSKPDRLLLFNQEWYHVSLILGS